MPAITYDFSRSRSQQAPIKFLAGYRGYIQADAFPGYDVLYARGDLKEVACWAHARRKFKEVAVLMKTPGRAHKALRFINRLYRIERQIKTLCDVERLQQRRVKSVPLLSQFEARLDQQANSVLPKSALGNTVQYSLKNWDALCRYTEQGFLEADNNYAERCMRPVALGRKNYFGVGSERGGKAAVIYYSLIESCKANKVNPLTYVTYLLTNVRNKSNSSDARGPTYPCWKALTQRMQSTIIQIGVAGLLGAALLDLLHAAPWLYRAAAGIVHILGFNILLTPLWLNQHF